MPKQERLDTRHANAQTLVQDFDLQRDAEFFSDPANRVAFLQSLNPEEFFEVAQHANARMRGYEPRDQVTVGEKGGSVKFLATPKTVDKPEAFRKGFQVIHDYLMTSPDSSEEKARGAGMAVEALIIWVHPFNDGNGRTARFFGKFIEDGTADLDELAQATVTNDIRDRAYGEDLRVDQANLYKGRDILIGSDNADEHAQIFKETTMPVSEGIAASLAQLLENKDLQAQVLAKSEETPAAVENWQAVIDKRNQAAA